ncbi:MAG: response regulator [Oculatellaceae cyanobacterium bins.114]|nr:response regulator [Oculatellaceae cyanobacterium bins.114]
MQRSSADQAISDGDSDLKQQVNFSLTNTACQILAETAHRQGISQSELIERFAHSLQDDRPSQQTSHTAASATSYQLQDECQDAEAAISLLNQSLQRRVEELQTLFDVIPICIAIAEDPQCHQVKANPPLVKLLGVPPRQDACLTPSSGNLTFKLYCDGQELRPDELPLQRAIAAGEMIHDINIDIVRSDGAVFKLFGYAAPLFDEMGQPRGAVSAFIDLTERKRTETALMQAKERFELASAAVRGVLYEWSAETHQIERSQGLCDLIGYHPEEVEPTVDWWNQQIHPDDVHRTTAIAQDALITGKGNFTNEYRVRHRDGQYRHVWDRAVIERDRQGTVTRIIGWSFDITDRVKAEAERAQLLEREQQARAAAERAQQQLTLIFETSPVGMGFLDGGQRFIAINEALAEINGLSQADHLGHTIAELFGQSDPTLVELFQRIYTTGAPFVSPHLAIHMPGRSDRRPGYYKVYYLPILHNGDQVESVLMYVLDETERFRLQEARRFLAESSNVLASSLDYQTTLTSIAELAVPALADWCSVHIQDDDSQTRRLVVTHVNPKKVVWAKELQQRYPYDPNEPRGVAEVIRTGKSEIYPEIPDALLVEAARDDDHLRLLREVGFSSIIVVPIKVQDRTLGAIAFTSAESGRHYDHVDLALAEELGRRAALAVENARLYNLAQRDRAKAEEANRIKDEFLAVLSHELRSPLNPIMGWTKLLKTRQFDSATRDRALDIIERNAKLQTQLVEDLLDVSRILQGKMVLNITTVDLEAVIKAALETVRLAAEAKGIKIHTAFATQVEPVMGDAGRLQQVVWNLLSNAIKFTPAGGRIDVKLEQKSNQGTQSNPLSNNTFNSTSSNNTSSHSTSSHSTSNNSTSNNSGSHSGQPSIVSTPLLLHPADYVQITVADTGKGIRPEFLPHVFDYFRQEDSTTTRRFGGLGLGLAIVQHLTELHGGTAKVYSAGEGQGASFMVRLPLCQWHSNTAQLNGQEPPLAYSSPLQHAHILVIDDEPDARELVTVILQEHQAIVRAVPSAAEALAALQEFQPHIIISDIGMPEVDGYTLLRQVRHQLPQYAQVPAIALTAYAGESNQQQALQAGFQLHLAKPIDPDQLIQAIATLLKK